MTVVLTRIWTRKGFVTHVQGREPEWVAHHGTQERLHLWLYTICGIGASAGGFDICLDLGYNGRWLAVTDG